ncbi:MAG: hypothetical protein ABSG53_25565 [Thermoguttaceae bacterium]
MVDQSMQLLAVFRITVDPHSYTAMVPRDCWFVARKSLDDVGANFIRSGENKD